MQTPQTIRTGWLALAVVAMAVFVHTAEGDMFAPKDAVAAGAWDPSEPLVTELLQEPSSDDIVPETLIEESSDDEPDMEKLASLEKDWKSKEQKASHNLDTTSLEQHAKLQKDMKAERDAKVEIQLQVSAQYLDSNTMQAVSGDKDDAIDSAWDSYKDEFKKEPTDASEETDSTVEDDTALAEEADAPQTDGTDTSSDDAQAQIAELKKQMEDLKQSQATELKKEEAQMQQKDDDKLSEVEDHLRGKLDAANKKLLEEQNREAKMVQQVQKQSTLTETTKVKMDDINDRRKQHKQDLQLAETAITDWHKKYDAEHGLRVKAVHATQMLGEKIKQMGYYGNKSSALAKTEALRAEKATADAKDNIVLIRAQKEKAKQLAAGLNATNFILQQQVAEAKADLASSEAESLHEKAHRQQVEDLMEKIKAELNETVHDKLTMAAQLAEHALKEKALSKEALKRKEEEGKALQALKKVDIIKSALTQAHSQLKRYQSENQLQRLELAHAAKQEIKAANVTRAAATNAEQIEKQALEERNKYRKWMDNAKAQLEKEHEGRMEAKTQFTALLKKAVAQLHAEHVLRKAAQEAKSNSSALVSSLQTDAQKQAAIMAEIKATADKVAADRDRLAQRDKAATQMIAVEQEATTEAKHAAEDLQVANEKKLAEMKQQYDELLKAEHQKSERAQAIADVVSKRQGSLKDAIASEKEVLQEEQKKAKDAQDKWEKALETFKKERKARLDSASASQESVAAQAQEAQLQINKATQLASAKDELLGQLKDQMSSQQQKFAKASEDWDRVKQTMMLRVKNAEQDAALANKKLADLTGNVQEDATAAAANSAVDDAISKSGEKMAVDVDHSDMSEADEEWTPTSMALDQLSMVDDEDTEPKSFGEELADSLPMLDDDGLDEDDLLMKLKQNKN